MKKNMSTKALTAIIMFILVFSVSSAHADKWPEPPVQDKGLPYTQSSYTMALPTLKTSLAFHPLSRYGYVYGKKTRFDNVDILRGEMVLKNNKAYLPVEAIGLLLLTPSDKPAPKVAYLRDDRWRYVFDIPKTKLPKGVALIEKGGRKYVDLIGAAKAFKLPVYTRDGLIFIGSKTNPFKGLSQMQIDNLVTLFDTPEKYVDPSLATKYIPLLKVQGAFTDNAIMTKKDLKLLEGPETEWAFTPREKYNLKGFDSKILYGEVPLPGIYPRLLFSETDLPAIRQRIKDHIVAQKSMLELDVLLGKTYLDPKSSEGELFDKLASGNTKDLTWDAWKDGRRNPIFPSFFPGYEPSLYSSHVSYTSRNLSALAFYALIKGDDVLGKKTAAAIANLYSLFEPEFDKWMRFSDSEFGTNLGDTSSSTTQFRGIPLPGMDMAFALDFAGKWMSDEQKKLIHRLMGQATYGRRTNGGDGPRRNWRDINHVTWHLTNTLFLACLEGLPEFDDEAWASAAELTADFLEWGINKYGTVYETNGKNGAGLHFEFLSMVALARRGDNLFGHPHLKKLLTSQSLNTTPNGTYQPSSGTWSGGTFGVANSMLMHSFYPDDPYGNYLLTMHSQWFKLEKYAENNDIKTFDLKKYHADLSAQYNRTRIPFIGNPALTMTVLYDTDWKPVQRSDLDAPVNFLDDDYGIMAAIQKQDTQSPWLHFNVRSSHYLGAGHHHSDPGMFTFASDGVNWITESQFQKTYDGKYHNQVLIDGVSMPGQFHARAELLSMVGNDDVAFGTADLKNAYDYRIKCQFTLFEKDDKPWSLYKDSKSLSVWKGTQRYKMRPWWPTGNSSNWIPNLKQDWNPVQYAFRSAGLVRGKHPYSLIVDDVKKDDEVHLYQWTAMAGRGVWSAGLKQKLNLPLNFEVVAHDGTSLAHHAGARGLFVRDGDPLLLVCLLGGEGKPADFGDWVAGRGALDPYAYKELEAEQAARKTTVPLRIETREGPRRGFHAVQFFYDRLVGGCYAKQVHFRTLLIPFKMGDELPEVTYEDDTATIKWPDQTDVIIFKKQPDDRTSFTIQSGDKQLYPIAK